MWCYNYFLLHNWILELCPLFVINPEYLPQQLHVPFLNTVGRLAYTTKAKYIKYFPGINCDYTLKI